MAGTDKEHICQECEKCHPTNKQADGGFIIEGSLIASEPAGHMPLRGITEPVGASISPIIVIL